MADPQIPRTDTSTVPSDFALNDDNMNRRIGLGILISVGANILLLQGAGVLAKNMSLNEAPPATADKFVLVHATPTPDATPSASPTPKPTPTPLTKHRPTPKPPKETPPPKPKPTPEPSARPTPTPKPEETPKPTATPEPIKVRTATPKPDLTPVPTPKVDIPKPETQVQNHPTSAAKIVEHTDIQHNDNPAKLTTPIDHTVALVNRTNTAHLGSRAPSFTPATRPTTDNSFTMSTTVAAPVPQINSLPHPSIMQRLASMVAPSTSIQTQSSNAPEVQTPNQTVTTSQHFTNGGMRLAPSHALAVLTRRNDSATPQFVVPSGTSLPTPARPTYQGSSSKSTAAAISSGTVTTQNSSEQALVNTGGVATTVGPIGVVRAGKLMSNQISELPSDHVRGGNPGAGVNLAAGNLAGAGGNSRLGPASTHGGTATFNPNAPADIQSSGGTGLTVTGGTSAIGTSRVASAGTGSKIHGGTAGTGIGGGARGSGTGDVGVAGGDIHGTGNGPSYNAKGSIGGKAGGIGSGEAITTTQSSGSVAIGGNSGTQRVGQAVNEKQATNIGTGNVGTTAEAKYSNPVVPPVPDSLKSTALDVNVSVLVTFGANGKIQARVTKGSQYPELDAAALGACEAIKLFKPAMENGTPVTSSHTFTLHFEHGG